MDDVVPPSLAIRGLAKSYGDVQVLQHIDITMQSGEFLVLVGPSGCGKSTLLNCIAGLEDISQGTLSIAGRDVTDVPPRDRDIAMVFQSYALYPTMSVAENIGFGMRIRKVPRNQVKTRVDAVAELLQIEHLLLRRPAELSGGQRQRVAMGRALVREPALFLFDEPLSNLDAKLRIEMRAEIKRLHLSTGASIVYVTHDQIEALTLATRIVVLNAGVIQQIGSPQDIYERPANTFVADFMGSPAMNLVEANVDASSSSICFDDGQRLKVNLPPAAALASRIIVGLRPEVFSRMSEPGSASESVLSVTPTMVENAGADAYVGFQLNQTPVTARLSGRFEQRPDQTCSLAVDTADLVFFNASDQQRVSH